MTLYPVKPEHVDPPGWVDLKSLSLRQLQALEQYREGVYGDLSPEDGDHDLAEAKLAEVRAEIERRGRC